MVAPLVSPKWMLERCYRPMVAKRVGREGEPRDGSIIYDEFGFRMTVYFYLGRGRSPLYDSDCCAQFVGEGWQYSLQMPGYGSPVRWEPQGILTGSAELMLDDVMLAVMTL